MSETRLGWRCAAIGLAIALTLSLTPITSFAQGSNSTAEPDSGIAQQEPGSTSEPVAGPNQQESSNTAEPDPGTVQQEPANTAEPDSGTIQQEGVHNESANDPALAAAPTNAPAAPLAASWDGDGSVAAPFLIANAADLSLLATKVNSGTNFDGQHFKVTGDIALDGVWNPIGTAATPFKGIFDGNAHTVRGVNVDIKRAGDVYGGLFGYLGGTSQVMNTTVEGSIQVESTGATQNESGLVYGGVLVGYAEGTTLIKGVGTIGGLIEGTSVTLADPSIGGLAGRAGKLQSITCVQNSAIKGRSKGGACDVGGVVGHATGTIDDVHVILAGIDAQSTGGLVSAGGLAGYADASITNSTVECAGNIKGSAGTNSCLVGGLVGNAASYSQDTIKSCTVMVRGSITGYSAEKDANAGGAVGMSVTTSLNDVLAKTTGTIAATADQPTGSSGGTAISGGLVGNLFMGIANDCGSSVGGDVRAYGLNNAQAGGSLGLGGLAEASASWVEGSILAEAVKASAGGFMGICTMGGPTNSSSIVNGDVKALGEVLSYAGGSVGQTRRSYMQDVTAQVRGNIATSEKGTRYAGGIVGAVPKSSYSNYSMISQVTGEITVGMQPDGFAGGITGYNDNAGSGTSVLNSVALVQRVVGPKAFRVGDAKQIDNVFEPYDDNYALSSALVNGQVVPDSEKGVKTRQGADWPASGKTWQDIIDNQSGRWTYPSNATPLLNVTKDLGDKLNKLSPKRYIASVAAGIENGTIRIAPEGLVSEHASVAVTVIPDKGYHLVEGSLVYTPALGGNSVPISNKSFSMPAQDVAVSGAFEKDAYRVSVAPDLEHGAIGLSPAGTVAWGTPIAVAVTPQDGYRLVPGSLGYTPAGGGTFTAIENNTFTTPESDVMVTAKFEKISSPPKPVPVDTRTQGGELVRTGDGGAGLIALAVFGALIAGVGLTLASRKR